MQLTAPANVYSDPSSLWRKSASNTPAAKQRGDNGGERSKRKHVGSSWGNALPKRRQYPIPRNGIMVFAAGCLEATEREVLRRGPFDTAVPSAS